MKENFSLCPKSEKAAASGGKRCLGALAQLNAPARASLFYTVGSIASRGAAFLLTPILTRLLSKTDYGAYSLFNSTLAILTLFGTLDICGSVFWRSMQKFEGERRQLLRSALLLISGLSTVTYSVYIILLSIMGHGEIFRGANYILLPLLIANGTVNLYATRCRFSSRYIFPLASSVILGVIAPAIACLTAALAGGHSEDALLFKVGTTSAITVAMALPLFIYIIFRKRVTEGNEKNNTSVHIKYILSLALPMLPYYISLSTLAQGDKLIISRLLGEGALASYAVAYSAGNGLTALTAGLIQALSPWIMRKVRSGKHRSCIEVTDRLTVIIASGTVLFLCFAPELFSFLAPLGYSEGLPCLFPVALSAIPLFLSTLLSSASLTETSPIGIAISGIIPAAVSLVLCFLLIGRYGIISAAIITAISYILLFLLLALNLKLKGAALPVNVSKALQVFLFTATVAGLIFTMRDLLLLRIITALLSLSVIIYTAYKSKALLKEES